MGEVVEDGGSGAFFPVEHCNPILCIDGLNNRQGDARTKFYGKTFKKQVMSKYHMHVYSVKCFCIGPPFLGTSCLLFEITLSAFKDIRCLVLSNLTV